MKIYFARSIRGQTNVNVDELQKSLREFGEILSEKFDYSMDVSRDRQIFDHDLKMLQSADVVIAEVSNPSLGVGYELGVSLMLGKPALCLAQKGVVVSAMITGNPLFSVKHYETIAEAKSHVSAFMRERGLIHV